MLNVQSNSRYFYLIISLFFKIVINIFLVFYIAKNVSVSDFGSFSLAFLIYSLCVLLVDYGFNLKGLVLNKNNKETVNHEISSMISAKIILVILMCLVLFLFLRISNYNSATDLNILILCLASIPNSFGLFFLNKFKIINRYDKESVGFILQGFVLLLSVAMFNYYGKDEVIWYIYSILLSKLIFFAYGLFSYIRNDYFEFKIAGINMAIESIRYSFPFAMHLILGALMIYIDTLVLSSLTDLNNVAIYQSGMRIIMASLLISVIISDAFIPLISNSFSSSKTVKNSMMSLFEFVLLFLFLVVITLFFFKKTIILLLYSLDYIELEKYIIYIIGIISLRYIGVVPGILLTSFGKQNIRANAVIISVLFSVVLNYIFIPRFNIEGAFLSSFLSHLILNIIYMYYALKIVSLIKVERYKLLFLLILICFGLQYFVFSDSINYLIITVILNIIIIIGYVLYRNIHKKLSI
jgi:O-antigen/teichoic acid export membrane protein